MIDDKTDVLKWDAFTEITLEENYLELRTGKSTLFFPKGNMEGEEFEKLSAFAKAKIKST
jgi:hypothetical protein